METMTTKSRFASGFSIVRNRIEADLGGGVTAVACLEHDSVATPDEFDCYTARDIREFNAGDWYYGTVTLKVAVKGTTVGRYLAAIGAVEIRPDRGDGFDAAVEAAEELLEECPVAKIVGDFAKKATAAALAMKKAK
jgi:hypothetical protein